MPSLDADPSGGLKTIRRAFQILEIVAGSPSAVTVRDLAAALDHNLSSIYNIVNTLIGAGYLTKDPSGRLRIGNRVALLNSALERDHDDARILRPYVEEVNATSGETVYLTRLTGGRVAIQLVVEGRQSLRVTGLSVGFSGAEEYRASGKAVMAFLPEARIRGILEVNHPGETADAIQNRLELLRPALEGVRAHGFAFDDEQFEEGICCVAAPYFDAAGRVAGSLAVSAPAVRREALSGAIRDDVVAVSRTMSAALGAPRPAPPA